MRDDNIKAAFEELLDYVELLDTRTDAILRLLKDKGITTDEKFIRYLDKDDGASDIRVRAARLRVDYLFSGDENAKPATDVKQGTEEKKSSEANSESASPEGSKRDAA
jgi:hypothetical protein